MADGTFAVLMALFGFADMGLNYCGTPDGCLGRNEVTPRFAISAGEVLERHARTQGEIYLRYDLGHNFGPFGNAAGLSVLEDGPVWVGFGQTYTATPDGSPFFLQFHAMPGLYFPNGGFDLGGPIEFRSGMEVGFEGRTGWRIGVSYDHRSHAGIYGYGNNPGIETVQVRVSIPTR
jgi:lipid A 3-O-deacylase